MKNRYQDYRFRRAKEHLTYCPKTGVFHWSRDGKNVKSGDVAGSHDADGYIVINVNGHPLKAHRLAWFWFYGVMPKETIDHINRVRDDNRIENLREATRLEQGHNLGLNIRNKSGHAGVFWSKKSKKWQAQISIKGQRFHVGLFDTLDEAVHRRLAMKSELMKANGIFQ